MACNHLIAPFFYIQPQYTSREANIRIALLQWIHSLTTKYSNLHVILKRIQIEVHLQQQCQILITEKDMKIII